MNNPAQLEVVKTSKITDPAILEQIRQSLIETMHLDPQSIAEQAIFCAEAMGVDPIDAIKNLKEQALLAVESQMAKAEKIVTSRVMPNAE